MKYYCKKSKILSIGNKFNLFVEKGKFYEINKYQYYGRNWTRLQRWPYAIHADATDGLNRWFDLTEFQFRLFVTEKELRKEKLKKIENIR